MNPIVLASSPLVGSGAMQAVATGLLPRWPERWPDAIAELIPGTVADLVEAMVDRLVA